MNTTHRLRHPQSRFCAIALFAVLAGCGGGSPDSETSSQSAASGDTAAAPQEKRANLILSAREATVANASKTSKVKGYLSWSPQVSRVDGAQASASFLLTPPYGGYYELFLWWPQGLSDAGSVQATISTKTGESIVGVDQRVDGGRWASLGFHRLQPGEAARVLLAGNGKAPLYVDALRAQFVGEAAPALQWRASELTVGQVGEDYESALEVAGGNPPYRFSLAERDLPAGLTLDANTGVLRGRPQAPGRFPIALNAHDAAGTTLSLQVELVIEPSSSPRTSMKSAARAQRLQRSGRDAVALSGAGSQSEPDLSNLLSVVAAMPEGAWFRANTNSYSEVWTPADLRTLYRTSNPTPAKIIGPWSSFTWDSSRGKLFLYGGGHANYRGNDTYSWNGSTRLWERASLPSQMVQDALGNWVAIDGPAKAPASAHTYDNTMYFPLLDRIVVLGGAADANGGHFLTVDTSTTSRTTGPYLFDPSRADGAKVGGSTGSHVQRVAPHPDIVGGNMWSNREAWLNAGPTSAPPSESFVNGCTGVTEEGGLDVAYVRTAYRVYRYRIHDLAQPAADTWELVGRYYSGSGSQATCTYDHHRRALVVAGRNAKPFLYWDMSQASSKNNEVYVTPADATGEFQTLLSSNAIDLRYCGLEYDPKRQQHLLWCGDQRVWRLTPPATLSASGWTITKAPTPPSGGPTQGPGTGILGKWKYIPNLDVFIGLQDSVNGDIWVYKPQGWVNPTGGNLPPAVSLGSPGPDTTVTIGATVELAASATDADGSVARVIFKVDGSEVGESTAAPYRSSWIPPTAGSYAITAVAVDDAGATTTSTPVMLTVQNGAPPNTPPAVALSQPAAGSSQAQGTTIHVEATASDTDGTVERVAFYADGTLIGEDTVAPYAIDWAGAPPGTHSLVARAIDNDGGFTDSTAVILMVTPSGSGGSGSVTLQRGVASAMVADTSLSSYHPNSAFGSSATLLDQSLRYSSLIRFAIFQSEGGPVPNGAVIESAVLSVYKSTAYDMAYGLHAMLVPWSESSSTWNQRLAGLPWGAPGANAAGVDYAPTPDATGSVGWSAGWVDFDITARVALLSAQPSLQNLGWRLQPSGGYLSSLKKLNTSEFTNDPSLRPKLVVTYR